MRMATYASRPAWELRARTLTGARIAAPLGIGVLIALSVLLRTRQLDVGLWIDEGLSVGIADRPIGDIPGVLRQDGSPPLYYLLLNVWLQLVGSSEAEVHGLSVLLAVLCVPVAWWGGKLLFGRRTAWIAALLAAVNPFMTQYAQEGRMYSLLTLLGLISLICWLHAFTSDAPAGGGVRRAPAIGFAVAFAAMLYTHNWALFFGAATGLVWLWLLWRAEPEERRRLLRTGLVAYGGAVLLYAPWIPNTLYQAAHTGAPWANAPSPAALASVPARMWGEEAAVAIVLIGGSGALALWRLRGAPARAVVALLVIAVATFVLAWMASQLSPAWANRYLAAGVAPFVLLAAAGLGAAGRLGLVALAVVAALWAIDGAPKEKSNVREVSEAIAPSLRPGDLVVATQPEQVSALNYYLPGGLRYATLTGAVPDVGVTDWRDGVERLERTTAARDLDPLLDTVPPGGRVALVVPQIYSLNQWRAPWTSLVRERSEEWLAHLQSDPRFSRTDVEPATPEDRVPNAVRAEVFVRR
jgi:mannosyltransferase